MVFNHTFYSELYIVDLLYFSEIDTSIYLYKHYKCCSVKGQLTLFIYILTYNLLKL